MADRLTDEQIEDVLALFGRNDRRTAAASATATVTKVIIMEAPETGPRAVAAAVVAAARRSTRPDTSDEQVINRSNDAWNLYHRLTGSSRRPAIAGHGAFPTGDTLDCLLRPRYFIPRRPLFQNCSLYRVLCQVRRASPSWKELAIGLGLAAAVVGATLLVRYYGEEAKRRLVADLYTTAYLKGEFDRFDRNDDGFITSEELGELLSCLGLNHTEAELQAMIEEAAPDGNGAIDFHEFLTIAHNWVIRDYHDYRSFPAI
uniref:EF-hand domain-containing protein n=1 Tax=Oryza meridionalis TaxID=40149 RepID=A0A0E0D5Q0_9ORYZ